MKTPQPDSYDDEIECDVYLVDVQKADGVRAAPVIHSDDGEPSVDIVKLAGETC